MPDPARELQAARLVYPFYHALIERFELEMFPCRDLEQQEPSADPEALTRIRLWFNEADNHIEVAHIRQFLQSTSVQEVIIRVLILRYLQKQEKTDSDRYKLDFLLGHYFAQNLPPDVLNQGEVKVSTVAQVLAPVLGDHSYLSFLEALDDSIRALSSCEHVQDLVDKKILEKGKHLKAEAGARYFHQAAMIAFTRFNFLARRCLIKLLATDLDEIGQALSELQARGTESFDCTAAGLSASESLASLRERIKQWRKPFQGKYSEVQWLEQISKVRVLLKAKVEEQAVPTKAAAIASEPLRPPVAVPKAPPEVPKATREAPGAEVPKPAVAVPAAAVAPATKSAAKTSPARPVPKTATAGAQIKSAASWLSEQWKAIQPVAERSLEAAGKQALDLWERAKDAVSQATSSDSAADEAGSASVAAAEPASAAARPASSTTIVQPSAYVREAIKRISEQAATLAADADTTITIQEIKLSLTAREVNAFRRPHDNLSGILQRSVAVRLILTEALKKAANGESINLNATLKFAYAELAMLQDRVTHARSNKDVEGAMLLSGCQRFLQALIDQAEGTLSHAASPSH